jgi:hypothetical protein
MIRNERHFGAIHEAGHAVVARKLGMTVSHVDARCNNPNVMYMHPWVGCVTEDKETAAQISEYEKGRSEQA